MGFLTRLLAGLLAASTLGTGLAGTANAVDAAGAASDATGAVTTTADDTGGRTVLDCRQSGEGATGPYADKFCWIDWSNLPLDSSGKPTPVRINVPGGHIDADATVTHTDNAALTAKDFTGNKWSRLTPAYRLTGNTALAFHHIQGNSADPLASVMFSNITSVANQTATSVNVLKDFQLAFGDAETMSGYVVNDKKTYEQTDIESDKMLDKLGMIGDANPNQSYSEANTGYGTTHVTLAGGPAGKHAPFTDDSNSKGAAVIGATQPTRFKVSFKQVNHPVNNAWSAIAIGVYMPYLTAYPLTYDKNSSDASGQVPSNQRGKENTTQPAKTKTSGIVKTVADDTSNLPDHLVNGDFNVNYKDQWLTGGWNWTSITPDGKYLNSVRNWNDSATTWKTVNGWDKTKFGWSSTQKDGTDDIQHKAGAVEIQYDDQADNVYAELCAYEAGTAIYQDIKTVPGTLYKVRLKHASLYDGYLDKMQVMIGAPGHEQPVEMTRTGVNGHGDKLNEKSNIIATKVSNTGENDRNHDSQWESYEGTYLIPAGQTVTRFTFRSVGSRNLDHGNLLDDIVFDKAYRLDYDKNSTAAAGEVPSNQRGKENTVQPAKTKTNGTVKTVADTNASLPDHLVNGDFSVNYHDQWKDSFGGWTSIDPNAGKTLHATSLPNGFSWKWTAINGWDKSKFGWTSTQKAGSNVQQKANAVELQYDDSTADNVYAELCAYEAGTAIYQDIRTVPGTLYKVRLKHASLNSTYLDKMQVMIGAPGHEQPVEMTRTSVNGHGDKLNEKSTTIATKVTNGNNRHHADQWETYEGTYLIPDGQTTTRFTFKSIDSKQLDYGNVLDDIVFDKAYRLDYDKNASDATGEVPSNQRGRENTTQPAKDKTSGSVKLVADDDVVEYTANGLPKQIVNSDFDHDWRNIVSQSKMSAKYNFANIDPAHGDVEISGALNSKGEASKHWVHLNGFDANKFGWKSNQTDTRVDGRGGIVEIQRSKANDNMYAEITASQANTYLYQDIDTAHDYPTVYTVKLRYAHRNGTINSNEKIQILVGAPGHEQPVEMTRIASDRGNRLGEKSTTVNAPNTDGWLGSWDTFQGSVVVPAGRNVSRFTFKALGSIDGISGNLIDDVQFKLAYKLSYDKNSQDASGQVPSNTTPDTTQTASSKSTGKVSDLVQRTTTHEDGSVTVKTIDTSTDVVSGCQVYYPAGQKITLATMAKDDDCWNSSMLSRPGHTQLGWNQDRNATQAQAQVTMVEGGMTVYAVWVGNPVLTYDTNKPSTWTGEMPSTPASVSVPYNTAAADGSGWQAGDVSKLRGYKFLGWYTGPQDNAGLYDWNTLLTGSVTVYAHWQRLQANVIYNANGGTGSHANTTGWQYSDVTIPGDTSKSFTRDGYVFKGWSLKAGKADVVYKDGSQIPLQDKDITLYAQWQGIHENFTETGGISLPLLIAGGIGLLVMGVGSTVMLTRRMNGHGMPDGE